MNTELAYRETPKEQSVGGRVVLMATPMKRHTPMRILLAAPDRDLLRCYQALLGEALGEVVTAFDAAQVLTLLSQGSYDLAVVDETLPRVDHARILELLSRGKTASLVLTRRGLTPGLLLREPLANAYLPYPFAPEELLSLVRDVAEKAVSGESFPLGAGRVRVSDFRLPSGGMLTAGELDFLADLAGGESVGAEGKGALAAALNHKLERGRERVRIHYLAGEGFKLVMNDE